MPVSRVSVALLLLLWSIPRAAFAQGTAQPEQSQRCDGAIAGNVDAGLLASDVLALLRLSDTFRAQCARIAADARVHVRLNVTTTIVSIGRAQTTFRRYRNGALSAEVEVLFGENYRELLAHEFEHVIEQIDGVDLRDEVVRGRAWEVAAGTFETRRAFDTGLRVLRESEALEAPVVRESLRRGPLTAQMTGSTASAVSRARTSRFR